MKAYSLPLFAAATLSAAPLAVSSPVLAGADVRQHAPAPVVARNCRAIDGDTLRCGSVRIRLLGIDAAELPGHCRVGRQCAPGDPVAQSQALRRLATGQLTVRAVTQDRYGRIVAQVRNAAGVDLSCAMIAAGATYKPAWDNGGIVRRGCAGAR